MELYISAGLFKEQNGREIDYYVCYFPGGGRVGEGYPL